MSVAAEPFFDPVTRLVIELTAAAKPRDPAAWLELLSRFTEAVVREALEHQDEIRERLGIADDLLPYTGGLRACPYCGAELQSGTMTGHYCERMRELEIDPYVDNGSTGAAEAETKAEHTHNVAPTAETPAAPSKPSRRCPDCGAHAGTLHLPDCPHFEASTPHSPASAPGSPGAAPPTSTSAAATDTAAGAPRALGPLAELEATRDAQPKRPRGRPPGSRTKPKPPDPTARVLTDAERARLNREYLDDRRANGGHKVDGWAKRKARELGMTEAAIYNAVAPAMASLATDKMLGKEQRRIDRALGTPPPRITRMTGTRY